MFAPFLHPALAQPQPPADTQSVPPVPTTPPPPVILDRDGNPVPPELQRELQERLRSHSPPDRPATPVSPARSTGDGAIVVEGQRPRGSVTGDIPPERTFSALEINAYGAGNVGELLQALNPQMRSNGGREGSGPVTLLNGRRVSSFSEIAEIPSEAIERVEVFPEELALQYGYRPDQKVVNIVTYERFRSYLGQLGAIASAAGGYAAGSVRANYFAIRGNTRLDFGFDYNRSSALLESDRDVAQLDATLDAGRFRTLLPETERLSVSGLVGGTLFDTVATTLTGRFEASGFQSLLGRIGSDALTRDSGTRTVELGTALHGQIGRWLWTFTGRYNHLATDIVTDSGAAANMRDQAHSANASANATLLLSGAPLRLPAGPLSTIVRGSFERWDYSSVSLRKGVDRRADMSRDSSAVQVSLNLPIARAGGRGAAALGDLSINANVEVTRLSDYDTLYGHGVGLNWSPIAAINLIASFTTGEAAPTLEQLGAPLLATANLRTFDLARREVVDITRITGGNPALRSEERRVFRLGLTVRPLHATDLTISADYVATRINDPIAPFPLLTPQLETAFPDRFTRAADGRLVQIDARPLNFDSARQQRLRWGFSFVRPLGTIEPWMRAAPVRTYASEAEARAATGPAGMVTMVQPGSALARRFENLASRLFVSIFHTWRFQDEIVPSFDGPTLDLLDGAAIDLRGGTRRHEIEVQAGVYKGGLGARVEFNWQSGISLSGGGGASTNDLFFSDLAIVNINLFANLQDRFGGANAPQWLRGLRLTFGITNLFDSRLQVRDSIGSTPLSYQPAYLDPIGRLLSVTLRKVF
ncbi:MAG: TonB-dependent receptor [Sphingomonas sp.]|nr:TonB-dependent receptor [Sphingomonas sp.]